MAGLSLREAAQQAGTSKSTILRAIRSGRLSASRTDDGGYDIQPAELFRVYPPKKTGDNDADQDTQRPMGHDAPPTQGHDAVEVRIRNVALRVQLEALKQVLEIERQRAEELRVERDKWHAQVERLVVALPDLRAAGAKANARSATESQVWWPWRRRA